MLSYQHAFHAGNHADVLKHVTLSLCLEALRRKAKPFFALDTHAGRGLYDLGSVESLKTGESAAGIARIWPEHTAALPALYARGLAAYNTAADLRRYPGSCQLIADALRAGDHAVFCERHPGEFTHLENRLGNREGVQVSQSDGFAATRAHLPPACGRGLILIDPSYETLHDYQTIPKVVAEIHRRFRAGIVVIWYPVLPPVTRMLDALSAIPVAGVEGFISELRVRSDSRPGLASSGVCVINAPWQSDLMLREHMQGLLPLLAEDDAARFDLRPIKA